MQISEKIKQLRKDKGLQQKQVAIDVGLDQSNYNKIENGRREPSLEVLQKLSAILDVSLDDLVNPEDSKNRLP
ncbi:helix-turn-helix domain-containing protein [Halpernia sp. GG3]